MAYFVEALFEGLQGLAQWQRSRDLSQVVSMEKISYLQLELQLMWADSEVIKQRALNECLVPRA
jgi:hypothetical protein